MKNILTDVLCTYTGGGIYVITAKLNDVYLACDCETYGTYDVPYDDIEEKYGCDYESHEKTSAFPLPTWAELLAAVRESYDSGASTNMIMSEVEQSIRYCHPDLSRRLDEEDPVGWSTDQETISDFVKVVEKFLTKKGIVVPDNDYTLLSDMLKPLLYNYGILAKGGN